MKYDKALAQLLRQGVVASGITHVGNLLRQRRCWDQRRDFAYLPLDVKNTVDIEVTEEAIAQRYEEDRSTYVTEPTVDVEWIEISQTDLEESIEVNESEEAASFYEAALHHKSLRAQIRTHIDFG